MRVKVMQLLVILGLGLIGLHHGIDNASAAGKKKDYDSRLDLPYGVEKKYTFKEGVGFTTDKNVPSKFQSQVDIWNKNYLDSLDDGSQTFAGGVGGVEPVVCSTDLDDEQMRICLGLPPVKKAVRVKKLQVELGSLQ